MREVDSGSRGEVHRREHVGLLLVAARDELVDDLRPSRWSKLAINCATSTLGAAGGDTLGRLLRHRFVRRLALEVWSELTAVAAKTGVRMAKVAGTLDIARLALTEAERLLTLLAALSLQTSLSVGCYCADEMRCHRSVLRTLLEEHGARLA